MERKKVTVLEIIYGLILKFGKIDDASVNVLVQQINKFADVEVDDNSKYYFITDDGFVILNPVAIDSLFKRINNKKLESVQSQLVKSYLDNLSLSEFVLRKIKLFGWVSIEKKEILETFSASQILELKKLVRDGYLIDYYEEDCIYDDYHAVKLTQKGEVDLFLKDNARNVDEFFRCLGIKCNKRETKIDFLMTQDLSLDVSRILNVDNFMCFCRDYDRPYPKKYKLKKTPTTDRKDRV